VYIVELKIRKPFAMQFSLKVGFPTFLEYCLLMHTGMHCSRGIPNILSQSESHLFEYRHETSPDSQQIRRFLDRKYQVPAS